MTIECLSGCAHAHEVNFVSFLMSCPPLCSCCFLEMGVTHWEQSCLLSRPRGSLLSLRPCVPASLRTGITSMHQEPNLGPHVFTASILPTEFLSHYQHYPQANYPFKMSSSCPVQSELVQITQYPADGNPQPLLELKTKNKNKTSWLMRFSLMVSCDLPPLLALDLPCKAAWNLFNEKPSQC